MDGTHGAGEREALIEARQWRLRVARASVSRLWISEVERGKPGVSLGLVLRVLASLGGLYPRRETRPPIPPLRGPAADREPAARRTD